MSNVGLITSGYSTLNGLYGYNNYAGGYTGGFYGGYGMYGSVGNTQKAKENIANNYDVYTTQKSYRELEGVETMSYSQHCQTMATLLREGRADEFAAQFENLVNQMKSSSQYANYSDSQIRALARNQYATAVGVDITADITDNATGSFAQGLKEGFPIIGTFFAERSSKEDLQAQVTGVKKDDRAVAGETIGATISGAGAGAAIGAGIGALCGGVGAIPGAIIGAVAGGVIGIVKSLIPGSKK